MFSNNAYNFEVIKMNHVLGIFVCMICGFTSVHFTHAIRPGNPFPNPDPDIIEGDIVMTPKEREMMRQGMNWQTYMFNKWPPGPAVLSNGSHVKVKGRVMAVVDKDYGTNQHHVINKCIDEWNSQVGDCVFWFKAPHAPKNKSYVEIKAGSGCSSTIGKNDKNEPQTLSLTNACLFGGDPIITCLHEMEHVIGMNHEHVRSDRDDYIEIIEENTVGYESEFVIPPHGQYDDLGTYDYYSIMHYNPNQVGNPLFRVKKNHIDHSRIGRGRESGDHRTFSEGDIEKIRILYGCSSPSA